MDGIKTITIDDMGSEGQGVGRLDGRAIFVESAVPGDVLEITLLKVKSTYGYGKLVKILQPSALRAEPKCTVFGKCGGCSLQHMEYSAQLRYKTDKVKNCIKRIGGIDCRVDDIIGMETPYHYRNKASFPMSTVKGKTAVGFYASRSHRVVPVKDCALQSEVNARILEIVESFAIRNKIQPYNEESHTGLIRHVFTRVGFVTGEIMVVLVINGSSLPRAAELVKELTAIKNMHSVMLNINTRRTNVILGDSMQTLWGEGFITDFIGGLRFEISPQSFYQVNPVQTKILYELVIKFAGLRPTDIVIDAYCGIGTISLFVAPKAGKVYGIEIVPEAIEDAKRNARINGAENAVFICGSPETAIPALLQDENVNPDIVIVDPPRKGCEQAVLEAIANAAPRKLIYVSCDPATLARDAAIMAKLGYMTEKIQPVDCFPMTPHVECVALMSRINSL